MTCSLLSVIAYAGPQAQPVPDLVFLERVSLEEFEPAVRDQIARAYDDALKKSQDAAATGRLGMLFQVYGKYEMARNCYRRAHLLDPRSFRWAYYLGAVEQSLGENAQAAVHIRDALALDGSYAPARVRLAQLLFDSGDASQSGAIYRSVIAGNPRMATAHFGLGRLGAAGADWAAAIASYRRACEIAPNYAAAHYALGMAYRNSGDLDRARTHLEQYQRSKAAKQPSEDSLMDDIASLYSGGLTHFAKGSSLFQEGRLRDAAAEFESALQVNPRLVMAHVNLIALYGQLEESDRAEQHFRAALDLDAGWVEAYYNWGMFLARHGRKTEATDLFRKAVEVNPNYADAGVQLGLLLDESGRPAEAAAQYERALKANPAHRQAHYFLARVLLRNGQADEAAKHLLETIKVDDEWTPVCMQALALAFERGGNQERAVYYLRQAKQRAVSSGMRDLASQIQGELDRLAAGAARP